MLGHLRVEGVIMILQVGKNGRKARKIVRGDVAEQVRGRHAIIESCTGNEDGKQHPHCIDQEMPCTPFDFLAAILSTLGATHLGGLDRLTLGADGARRGLTPCVHAGLFAQCFDPFFPGPIGAPWGKGGIDGAFGE